MTIQGLYKMLSCPVSQQLHLGIHVWIEQHINLKIIPSPLRNQKRTSIQGKESCIHRLHIFSFCILQKLYTWNHQTEEEKHVMYETNRKETLPCIFLWLLSFNQEVPSNSHNLLFSESKCKQIEISFMDLIQNDVAFSCSFSFQNQNRHHSGWQIDI